jgi:excisionase family DNA binding protein
MKVGYRPFPSVKAYIDWYFASLNVYETTNRNNIGDEGLGDILLDLSMHQFLLDDEISELRDAWERMEDVTAPAAYSKLAIQLEASGWVIDRLMYNILRRGSTVLELPDKKVLSAKEVGDILGISTPHVQRLARQGKIPPQCYTRVGGDGEYRFWRSELEALFKSWAGSMTS